MEGEKLYEKREGNVETVEKEKMMKKKRESRIEEKEKRNGELGEGKLEVNTGG